MNYTKKLGEEPVLQYMLKQSSIIIKNEVPTKDLEYSIIFDLKVEFDIESDKNIDILDNIVLDRANKEIRKLEEKKIQEYLFKKLKPESTVSCYIDESLKNDTLKDSFIYAFNSIEYIFDSIVCNIIINKESIKMLRDLPIFVWNINDERVLNTGFIGTLFGAKVFVSNNIPKNEIFLFSFDELIGDFIDGEITINKIKIGETKQTFQVIKRIAINLKKDCAISRISYNLKNRW